MKVIYFDCFSGLSGDMTLAALVDAGADPEKIQAGLKSLPFENVTLLFENVIKKGISAKKLYIHIDDEAEAQDHDHHHEHNHDHHEHSHTHDHVHDHHEHSHHDHDHEHSHTHDHDHHHEHSHLHDHEHHHEHSHDHVHTHDHDHPHEHSHGHDHDHHHHHHRGYREIAAMIQEAELPERAKQRALEIFKKIGIAEAKIHGIPLERVHFHEVGAVDSIVDIVGAAIALEDLGIEKIYASPVAVGSGYVKCDHGLYPVPAPATLEMLKNIPIRHTHEKGELTTPTGAGIISLASSYGALPAMTVEKIGYGAGTKELIQQPNVLRVIIGEM